VTAKAAPYDPTGFDDRLARRGFGYFLTAKSIEPMHATSLARIFAIVPGLRMVQTKFGNRLVSRGIDANMRDCAPAVFLDGSIVYDGAQILENVIRPDHLRGMEVYLQSGSAPPPYDRDPCGTILVWTKPGGPREPRPAASDSTP
jgi:hypothetical protein